MSGILSAICTNYNATPPTPPVTYATWNPADISADVTLSNGNLTAVVTSASGFKGARSTIGKSSGKWYWEIKGWATGGGSMNGVGDITESLTHSNGVGGPLGWGVRLYQTFGDKQHNDGFSAFGNGTYADANTITGYALDMDAGTLEVFQNNVSLGVAWTGITGTVYPMLGIWSDTTTNYIANFGATPLTYTPPVGFNAGLYA